jgi:hypothetical protein
MMNNPRKNEKMIDGKSNQKSKSIKERDKNPKDSETQLHLTDQITTILQIIPN